MAAVDAAQLDFTSPLLKASAALPCSEIRPSPSSWDELSPVGSSPRATQNPPCPLMGSPDPRLPSEAVPPPVLLRLQVNKAPGGFIALLDFVPPCYWPRLNLLPRRQSRRSRSSLTALLGP